MLVVLHGSIPPALCGASPPDLGQTGEPANQPLVGKSWNRLKWFVGFLFGVFVLRCELTLQLTGNLVDHMTRILPEQRCPVERSFDLWMLPLLFVLPAAGNASQVVGFRNSC